LKLIGAFEIHLGGNKVPLPLTAQRVLAFLGLQPCPVARSQVAGTLWMHSSEGRAAASLRSALWRLRQSGFELVRADSQVLLLSPTVSVDLQDAVVRAHRLLGWKVEGHTGVGSEAHLDWLALSGELLPGWYDDWVIIERERFNQLRLHALEALCEALTAEGQFGPAIEAGQAAVAGEPLRESAHRCLMLVHLSEGNRSDAVHQYNLYRKLCLDELGCEPSDRMAALLQRARGGTA
jgi:DNA-binding SARP family transcriptional activator